MFHPILLISFVLVTPVLSVDVLDVTGAFWCADVTVFLSKLMDFKNKMSPTNGFSINYRPSSDFKTLPGGDKQNISDSGEIEKFQACAKKYIPNDYLPIIYCMQTASNGPSAEICAQKVPSAAANIKKCGNSTEGDELLRIEQHTRPNGINWLPWIMINGIRVADAEQHPKKYLCQLDSLKGNKACQ